VSARLLSRYISLEDLKKTVLFEVVKKHYTTWHKNAKNPVPKYIDKEFKNYLGCGILAKGFAYGHCEGCHKDFLIAFSCKGRGICPSCNTRTMVQIATHLSGICRFFLCWPCIH